jgi:hypothetical protein
MESIYKKKDATGNVVIGKEKKKVPFIRCLGNSISKSESKNSGLSHSKNLF